MNSRSSCWWPIGVGLGSALGRVTFGFSCKRSRRWCGAGSNLSMGRRQYQRAKSALVAFDHSSSEGSVTPIKASGTSPRLSPAAGGPGE